MELKHSDRVSVFRKSHQVSEGWIDDLTEHMPWLTSDQAYRLLKAVLHALRDQMPVDEVAQFSAQLPLVIRGMFFEQWNPGKPIRLRTKDEFLEDVRNRLRTNAQFELHRAIGIVMSFVRQKISEGEMQDLYSCLTPEVRDFITKPVGLGSYS